MLLVISFGPPAAAQNRDQITDHVNQGVVGIMCGRTTGSYLYFCEDMAVLLNDDVSYTMRLVPMIGEGGFRNVEDLLYLRGVDLALTNADTLDFLESQGLHGNIKQAVRYVTAMAGLELHILARDDIKSIADLAGKKVNFSSPGTGTYLTMTNVFETLDIDVEVQSDAEAVALDRLKRGEIAAMGFNAAPPWKVAANLDGSEGLKLLDVPSDQLVGPYEQASWSSKVYPNLIPAGQTVTSSRVPMVLLAYNWTENNPRCSKVQRFAEALRADFPQLQNGPYQPRWKQVDINATVRGLEKWNKSC